MNKQEDTIQLDNWEHNTLISQVGQSTGTNGIYCLANDRALDWTIAFLNSFRKWNPTLPLVIIPFDDNTHELQQFTDKYDFTIMDSPCLAELDRLGASLTERPITAKMFRKFAAFSGVFDTFIYFDSDVIVLDSLQPILDACTEISNGLVYYDEDMVMDWVYPNRAFADYMIAEYNSVGFNAGAFASRRNVVRLEELTAIAEEANQHRSKVWNNGWDQVFLNYVIDVSHIEKIPLSRLVERTTEAWPGRAFLKFDGDVEQAAHTLAKDTWIPFLHYAGYRVNLKMPLRELWLDYRLAGCPPPEIRAFYRTLIKNTVIDNHLYRKSVSLFQRTS